ncbi:MAG TPA: tetratricopeptide repeat protein [Geobacteraceae bacterium]|nr:tetratricopeptide repeat protein [Geobacteraceae bacterium]
MDAITKSMREHSTEIIFALLFALICAFPAGIAYEKWKSRKEVNTLQRNLKTVVQVVAYDHLHLKMQQGSGFIVAGDGAIATALHVLDNAAEVEIKLSGETGHKSLKDKNLKVIGLLFKDPVNDVAILKVDPGKNRLTSAVIADAPSKSIERDRDQTDQGKRKPGKVTVISSPEGMENTVTSGDFGNTISQGNRKALLITAPISPGSSGGPVFNEDGEVIGIIRSTSLQGNNINFAVPAYFIKDKISNKKFTPIDDTGFEDLKLTSEYWTTLGFDAMQAGQFVNAVYDFQNAIHFKGNNKEAHQMLGLAYQYQGKLASAVNELKTAHALKPDDKEVLSGLARAYRQQGNFKQAADTLAIALGIPGTGQPDNYLLHGQLGEVYMGMQKNAKAVVEFCRVLENAPKDEITYQNIGNALYNMGEYELSVPELKQAIRYNTNYVLAYYGLGMTYFQLGRYDDAAQEFERVIRLTINHGMELSARYQLGLIFASRNEALPAFREYQAVTGILRDNDQASLQSGFPDAGSFEQAMKLGAVLIKKYPLSREAAEIRKDVRSFKLRVTEEYKKLVVFQDKNIESFPGEAMPYFYRGFDYMKIQQYDRAERDLKKALSINPDDPVIPVTMAELYSLANRPVKACAWFRKGIELGFDNRNQVKTDDAFENLRKSPCYAEFSSKAMVGRVESCGASGTRKINQ